MQRRTFLSLIASASAVILLPSSSFGYARNLTLYTQPFQTLFRLHQDLFAHSGIALLLQNINAVGYFSGVLDDAFISEDTKRFMRNGFTWLDESASKYYDKTYIQLDAPSRQNVLKHFSQTRRGHNWLVSIYSYFFEAMLCDPVYGANKDVSGWRYLDHYSGLPRPKMALS
jgi:gluconate 2-dehydrogenase gamma chain